MNRQGDSTIRKRNMIEKQDKDLFRSYSHKNCEFSLTRKKKGDSLGITLFLLLIISAIFWILDSEKIQLMIGNEHECSPGFSDGLCITGTDSQGGCLPNTSQNTNESLTGLPKLADSRIDALNSSDPPNMIDIESQSGTGIMRNEGKAFYLSTLRPDIVTMNQVSQLIGTIQEIKSGARYRVAEGFWDNKVQKLHVLTIDGTSLEIKIKPMLSFDRLFGYELLSDMSKRTGAIAAVNAGFSYSDGRPSGLVLIDQQLMYPSDNQYPSLLITENSASLGSVKTELHITANGTVRAADYLNRFQMKAGIGIYTPIYGTTDRINEKHYVVTVQEGKVLSSGTSDKASEIPKNGFLIAGIGEKQTQKLKTLFPVGALAAWSYTMSPAVPDRVLHGMSCGNYVVLDGKNVVQDKDPWIGSLTSPAPRTAVGFGYEGQLVFIVAEGRIKNGAVGFTGRQFGQILLEMGIQNAAMLDGGASSELLIGDDVKNKLSADRERLLPFGFALTVIDPEDPLAP